MLVAAANPCPCGHGADSGECKCPTGAVRSYEAKLSGALADRIDLLISVEQPSSEAMAGEAGEELGAGARPGHRGEGAGHRAARRGPLERRHDSGRDAASTAP